MLRRILLIWFILLLMKGGRCFSVEDSFEPLEKRTSEKARGIILPSVEINDLPLPMAIRYLEQEAKKYDPKHVGLKITLAEWVLWPRKPKIGKEVDTAFLANRVTISQKNITLRDALMYTGAPADCLLIPTLDGFLMIRDPKSVEILYTHTIRLPDDIFGKTAVPARLGIDLANVEKIRSNLKGFFADNGIHFAGGGGCSFDPKTLTITITATNTELQSMHEVLEIVFKTRRTDMIQ